MAFSCPDNYPYPYVFWRLRLLISNIMSSAFLYFFIFVAASIFTSFLGLDIVSAVSSVAVFLVNVGPGLGLVAPPSNYGFIPAAGKWLLSFLYAGRPTRDLHAFCSPDQGILEISGNLIKNLVYIKQTMFRKDKRLTRARKKGPGLCASFLMSIELNIRR